MSKIITVDEFINLVSEKLGSQILSVETKTDARAKKTGNPFGQITKRQTMSIMTGFTYDAGVLRRLAKEGKSPEDFQKGESWHEAVLDGEGRLTPFARHKGSGELYLRVMHLKNVGETRYFDQSGSEITREQCEKWLPKKNEYANQGLEQPLIFLTLKLSSVTAATISGERVEIDHEEIQPVIVKPKYAPLPDMTADESLDAWMMLGGESIEKTLEGMCK